MSQNWKSWYLRILSARWIVCKRFFGGVGEVRFFSPPSSGIWKKALPQLRSPKLWSVVRPLWRSVGVDKIKRFQRKTLNEGQINPSDILTHLKFIFGYHFQACFLSHCLLAVFLYLGASRAPASYINNFDWYHRNQCIFADFFDIAYSTFSQIWSKFFCHFWSNFRITIAKFLIFEVRALNRWFLELRYFY